MSCRVPLQYLTGSAHWRDLVLAVGPGALIPRPETELLIDFAQEVRPCLVLLAMSESLSAGQWAIVHPKHQNPLENSQGHAGAQGQLQAT